MEPWELDFEWLRIRHQIKGQFGKTELPDLRSILFLIGIQECGFIKEAYTKEEKQDLMHVAVCSLMEGEGYYKYIGRDEDGWPHFDTLKAFTVKGVKKQEELLKKSIIEYFNYHKLKVEL